MVVHLAVSCDLVYIAEMMQSSQNFQIIPNLMLKASEEQTILSVALWKYKLYDIVVQLLQVVQMSMD
jgi:hypothetical protein